MKRLTVVLQEEDASKVQKLPGKNTNDRLKQLIIAATSQYAAP